MNDSKRPAKVSDVMSDAERIGIIGSPSSTAEVCLEIMGHSVSRKLVGELVLFDYLQDGMLHYALGQINEIRMSNFWHESPNIRGLARRRGRVEHVSTVQDTHQGKMLVSAVFGEIIKEDKSVYEPSILGTVPATGTSICLADDVILSALLHPYRNQLFYLGNVYGSTPKMPMWFKHFDSGKDGSGAGEAYHLGIFGKTGAGKSVLAKMIMLAYAQHRNMAILIIDPQGEFSKDTGDAGESEQFPIEYLRRNNDVFVRHGGKKITRMTIQNITLDTWDMFSEILGESLFFERLTIPKGENRETACGVLVDKLKKARITLSNLHKEESFDKAWELLGQDSVQQIFYRSESPRRRFADALSDADKEEFYQDYWKPVAELFNNNRPDALNITSAMHQLLDSSDGERPILLIDLSKDRAKNLFWNDKIQSMVIKRILDRLVHAAGTGYQDNQNLNTLVIIDEAHRLAPRVMEDDVARGVRSSLIDAVRTTRKYGLGWLFISQSLSSLHVEILQQMRIMFFGFGLGLGSEFQSLKQLVGSTSAALDLYQTFRDPHSALDPSRRQYPFMTVGPVSPLSFSGTPLFFNAFNSGKNFISANFPEERKEDS